MMAGVMQKAALCGGLARYLDNAALSDYTIVCNDKQWEVHRLVLSLHSAVFAKACDGQLAEAKDMKYDLSSYGKNEVEALIKYLYTFDYTVEGKEVREHLLLHVSMCCIADKYDITPLRQLTVGKFKDTILNVKASNELVGAIEIAYGFYGATADIRDSMVQLLAERFSFLDDVPGNKALLEAMQSHPNLAIEVVRATTKKYARGLTPVNGQGPVFQCPQKACRAIFQDPDIKAGYPFYKCPQCSVSQSGTMWHKYYALA